MANSGGKWMFGALGLAALGAAAAYWHFREEGEGGPEYHTVEAAKGDLTQVVTATGALNPVVNVQVGSQVSGIMKSLMVDWNSTVKSNQVVAQLDPASYQAVYDQTFADLASSKAGLALAKANADRSGILFTNSLVSKADFDTAIAGRDQAAALVMLKQAAVNKARVDLDNTTIYSPIDGVVISRSIDVGQTVAASFSAPTLFQIANDLAKMQIDASVSEADVGGVDEGQAVDFSVDAFPTRTFHGKVTQIRDSPVTVQNVVTYDTVISVRNDDLKLRPGMTANLSIILAQKKDVLKIPNSALRFHPPGAAEAGRGMMAGGGGSENRGPGGDYGGGPGGRGGGAGRGGRGGGGPGEGRGRRERAPVRTLYLLSKADPAKGGKGAKPAPVQVHTGISDGVSTEILDGLKEGDLVVIGQIMTTATPQASQSPFGGGGRRF
jgi:HlyD family secretion protein